MKIESISTVKGRIVWLEVRSRSGKLKKRIEDVPNLLLNHAFSLAGDGVTDATGAWHGLTSSHPGYEDLDGTWSQTGNTVARSTGSATFPSSPSQLGNELYWYDAGADTGHRCHVISRTNDTTITVSGLPKNITGAKIRRFSTNGQGISSTSGSNVQQSTASTTFKEWDNTSGIQTTQRLVSMGGASSPFTLNSLISVNQVRVVLPEGIAIDTGDVIQFTYERTETCTGRSQTFEIGPESSGIPMKYPVVSIVGDGTNVDVTFDDDTIFLAGDKLDLRNVTTLRIPIATISSDGTEWTITTEVAHGLNPADNAVITGTTNPAYIGTWPVASVSSATVFKVSDISNPGASTGGMVRLETPVDYFDSLGLATIDSMVSPSVARILSDVTGPAVDTAPVGGDPGCEYRLVQDIGNASWRIDLRASSTYFFNEANARPLADITALSSPSSSGASDAADSAESNSFTGVGGYSTDFTLTCNVQLNAGTGTGTDRIKQIQGATGTNNNQAWSQFTFNTPFTKTDADRFRLTISKKYVRDIPTP